MKKPFFSVIIPTYNRADFLQSCIDSVLGQTEPDFELLIADDGSTDNTADIVKSFADKRLIYLKLDHHGVSHARNQAIKSAKSDNLAFLDSDDRFKPNKLKVAKEYLDKSPEFHIFHTEEIWYRDNKLLNQKKIHKKPDGQVFVKSLRLCCIGMSTVIIRKNVFQNIGFFDEQMPSCEDYDLWLRASLKYKFKLIPEVLTIKNGGHPDQLSKKYPAMDTLRIYAIDKLLKTASLTKEQRDLAIEQLIRKAKIYINGAKKRKKLKQADYYIDLINHYQSKDTQEHKDALK